MELRPAPHPSPFWLNWERKYSRFIRINLPINGQNIIKMGRIDTTRPINTLFYRRLSGQIANDVVQNTAMTIIIELVSRIDTYQQFDRTHVTIRKFDRRCRR